MATTQELEPTCTVVVPADNLWQIVIGSRRFWCRTYAGHRTDEEARRLVIRDAKEWLRRQGSR